MPAHSMKKLKAPTATAQTVSFKPDNEWPSSVVYVRVLALCKNATSTSPTTATYACARGRSPGYLQVRTLSGSGVLGLGCEAAHAAKFMLPLICMLEGSDRVGSDHEGWSTGGEACRLACWSGAGPRLPPGRHAVQNYEASGTGLCAVEKSQR